MNYIDLFAGCGGLSLGLHNAGLEGIFAVEKNKDAFSTLEKNLIQKRNHFSFPKWLNQENLDINELLKKYRKNLKDLKNVDLIVGGPPCQGFSMAGRREKSDSRNGLMKSYLEMVELTNPKYIFFENVYGFTVAFDKNKNSPSSFIKKELEKLGYNIDSRIVNVSEYGVPQNRKRFILFGSKQKNAKLFFEILETKKINKRISIQEAISDLERTHGEVESSDTRNFKNGLYGKKTSDYQISMTKNSPKIPDSHRFAKHKEETVRIFKELMKFQDHQSRITPKMFPTLKKRGVTPLKPKEVCNTITSIPDDYIHYSEPRILTVREYARIQSFPDDYLFCGPYTTGGERRKFDVPRYTQIANAIPPIFAEIVGQVLKEINDG